MALAEVVDVMASLYEGCVGPLSPEPDDVAAEWIATASLGERMELTRMVQDPQTYTEFVKTNTPSPHRPSNAHRTTPYDAVETLIDAWAVDDPLEAANAFVGLLGHPLARPAALFALEGAARRSTVFEPGRKAQVGGRIQAILSDNLDALTDLTDIEREDLESTLRHLDPTWASAFVARLGPRLPGVR